MGMNGENDEIETKFIEEKVNISYDDYDDTTDTVAAPNSKYTFRYRILKTLLFHFSYIALGLNNELFGLSVQDLIILFGINYQQLAKLIISKILGYLVFMSILGFLIHRYLRYSDFLIAISNILIIIPNLLLPWTRNVWLAGVLFLIQGMAQAVFDLCSSGSILSLWAGISNSPIVGAQAGYGIGALVAVFLIRPFIKFNPLLKPVQVAVMNNQTNYTAEAAANITLTQDTTEITLQVPYSVASLVGLVVAVCFTLIQFYEFKLEKHAAKQKKDAKGEREEMLTSTKKATRANRIVELMFNEQTNDKRFVALKFVQTVLLMILCMTIGAFSIVLVNYMQPYMTIGPAKLSIETYFKLQMVFWVCNVAGRLLAALIGYKMNSLVYAFALISLNFTCIAFYAIPYFNKIPTFYWIIMFPLSLVNGPYIPSIYMIAQYIMVNVTSAIISSIGLGFAIGAIAGQYLTGYLVDEFRPSATWLGYTDATSYYVIPIVLLTTVGLSLTVYLVLILVYKRYKHLIVIKTTFK